MRGTNDSVHMLTKRYEYDHEGFGQISLIYEKIGHQISFKI
jgi:hypothetical protein